MPSPGTVITAYNKIEYDNPLPRDKNFNDLYGYFDDTGQSLLLKSGDNYLLLYFDFADILDEISDNIVTWTFGEDKDRYTLTMFIKASFEDAHHAFVLKKNAGNKNFLKMIRNEGTITLECIAPLYGHIHKLKQAKLTIPDALLQIFPQ